MKPKKIRRGTIESVSDAIIREIKKWDGAQSYGDMIAAACSFSLPLAKRLVRIVRRKERSGERVPDSTPAPANAPKEGTTSASTTRAISNAQGQPVSAETSARDEIGGWINTTPAQEAEAMIAGTEQTRATSAPAENRWRYQCSNILCGITHESKNYFKVFGTCHVCKSGQMLLAEAGEGA